MKKLLLLALALVGFGLTAPRAQASPITIEALCAGDPLTVSSDTTFDEASRKAAMISQCSRYILTHNKVGAALRIQQKNVQTGEPLPPPTGFDYSSGFCWCANTANAAQCTTGGVADSAAACTASCQQLGTVSRHFEQTYRDYRGTTENNKCGNYCWCMEPTAATGTETRCVLHRTTTRTINGASREIPLTDGDECTALCRGLNAGTRTGTAKHYETSYHNYQPYPTCDSVQAQTPTTNNTPTPRVSTPAPTVRLFNPMAGASTIVDIVNRAIKILMSLVGAGALLMFIYGGIKWMTAGGDAKNVADAQTILKNSTLGLLLLIFAYSIVSVFFSVLT